MIPAPFQFQNELSRVVRFGKRVGTVFEYVTIDRRCKTGTASLVPREGVIRVCEIQLRRRV
jgi:hypothetical protein